MALYEQRGAVLYGPTALQVLGVALPESIQDWDNCHLMTPRRQNRPIRRGVIVHRRLADQPAWQLVNGLPLLHPVDHWVQLEHATVDELIEAGDGLMRRRYPLLTMDQFRQRLSDLGGTTGVRKARRAFRWLEPNTDSLWETRTRLALVHAGLDRPIVNCPVPCPAAGRTYHVDMGYDKEKLAIEYDGTVHVGSREQMEIDAIRRRDIQDQGWMIITVTASQLLQPASLVRSVETALVLRRAQLRNTW